MCQFHHGPSSLSTLILASERGVYQECTCRALCDHDGSQADLPAEGYDADDMVHSCRSLQGEPYAAVFHRRIKMSSGGHRLKIEQKFQLLSPGVMPVQYHSIWHRCGLHSCSSPWPAHGLMHCCG